MNTNVSVRSLRRSGLACICAFITVGLLPTSSAAASWPPGSLTSTEKDTQQVIGGCTISTESFTWKFTDPQGVAHTFAGTSQFITEFGSCKVVKSTVLDEWSTDAQYYLQATGATGSVTAVGGYVNPKYVILGVTYAPPGPSSFVNYSSSTLVANQTTLNSSFSSAYALSVKVSASISGWLNGSVSGTSSTSYTQASNTTSSVTISKMTGVSDQTLGPTNPYLGINHDLDIIWLWLNPVSFFSFSETSSGMVTNLQWNGYGYSALDQPGMDVYPVYVGWLNGDIAIPTNVRQVLNRTWAAGEIWPSGQVPALTSTDFQVIEGSDLYWQCTKVPTACPATVSGTRFSGPVAGKNFVYQQAALGGGPITQTYTDTNTNATAQGQGATYTSAQTFALEQVFGGKVFNIGLTTTLNQSTTLTWVTQWNKLITTTNSSTAGLSITGPPCVASGSACNPVYTGSTEFDVYQDNLYGTFLFYPLD